MTDTVERIALRGEEWYAPDERSARIKELEAEVAYWKAKAEEWHMLYAKIMR